jgi:hypothetical protein
MAHEHTREKAPHRLLRKRWHNVTRTMKITKINYFILLFRLTGVLVLILGIVIAPFLPTENSWVVIPIIGVFMYLIFVFLRSTILDTITIHLKKDKIELSRFLGYKHQALKNEAILGFSDSEIEIGRFRKKIKTIIIYTKDNEAFELIKYNYMNFNQIRDSLQRFEYLGYEPYQTGWMFRKYKFINEHNMH